MAAQEGWGGEGRSRGQCATAPFGLDLEAGEEAPELSFSFSKQQDFRLHEMLGKEEVPPPQASLLGPENARSP